MSRSKPLSARKSSVTTSDALVSVYERVIAGEAEAIGSGQVGEIGRTVGEGIAPPPCERRVEEPGVAHACRAAMLGKPLAVESQHRRTIDPDGLVHAYLASSRSAFRRLFMIRRASFICSSKPGS